MRRIRIHRLAAGLVAGLLLLVPGIECALAQDLITPAGDEQVRARRPQLQGDRDSPVLGNPQGDVTIVEFFDYACGYCKAVEPRLAEAVRRDGHVRLVLKEFPILTPESQVAARASIAAMRQMKYEPFHAALMAYRGEWNEDAIYATARGVGVDMGRLRRDMADPRIANELLENFNLARALRLFQTPAFVVGDHILRGPSASIDFPAAIAEARRAAAGR